MRLMLAFIMIGSSFTISAVATYFQVISMHGVISQLSIVSTAATGLQTLGYFFLAFSHVVRFQSFKKMGIIIPFIGPISLLAIFNILSLYFLLYGSLQTAQSYIRMKKTQTLIVTLGIALIASGEFVSWFGFFPDNSIFILISLVLRILGISIFLIPVLSFTMKMRDNT
tara:strand:- start:257 stop:763 length:507 start_codon:yes stop_codon:yes gene_type:complete